MEKGVIYVATGEGYRDLAAASARSLRQQQPGLGIDLFTDAPGEVVPGLFDRVHQIVRPHLRSKIDCMALTRFERTLYLDADTLVIAPLGDLFDLLDRFDMALAHDMRRCSDLIRAGHEVETPYAFPQFNSGVVLYRNAPRVLDFLREWARRFDRAGLPRDQPVLRDMLWQGELDFYVLPPEFNLRRVTMLDAWEPQDARPTILHSHRFKDHLSGAQRIGDATGLIEVERAALEEEWRQAGKDDPIARFRRPASD